MKGGNCTAQKVTASGQEVKSKLNARAFCLFKRRYVLSPLVFPFLVVHTNPVVSTLLHTTTYPSTLPLLLSPNQGHHNTTSLLFYFIFLFALVSVHTSPLLLYICTYLCPSSLLFYTLKPLPHSLSSPSGHDEEEEGECPSSLLFLHTPEHYLCAPSPAFLRPLRRRGGRIPQLPFLSTHSKHKPLPLLPPYSASWPTTTKRKSNSHRRP